MFFGFCTGGRHGEGLQRFKVIPERPAWKVSTIVKEKKDKALRPKADQWKALIEKLIEEGNLRDLALVLVAGTAGLRREELCNLLWQDLTLVPDGSRVDISVRQGKGDKDRETMGSAEAAEALLVFRESLTSHPWMSVIGSGKDSAPVFATVCTDKRTGGFRLRVVDPDSVSALFLRLSAELGWRVTCHSLRHFAAHTWIENGASVVDARNLLGHSSIVVTQMYVDEEASSSLEKLSGIWKARAKSTVPQVPPRRMAIKPVGRLAA
jgi:integrase